ncbi:MAG: UDP-N-acetylmuramoyl-L-alanine--D-glutamate ligase [Flavobacteriales bacterium]|nr:UDP-N-acetylmuramoyl-L-alanine--D-glutamate ligase [Flavobacteriales bacterium]
MSNRVVILGGGESGTGAAYLAMRKGMAVFLSDKGKLKEKYVDQLREWNIDFEEGKHSEERILAADLIVKSPGIPEKAPLIQKLRAQGTPIISEIEFALRHTDAKVIGITGTNGKTTTTMLTYHILTKAGLNVCLAGNVGQSLALQVADNSYDYLVLELSSFQLDDMHESRINYAVLLNITPDHLDRYGTMEAYIASKFRIARNQTAEDTFIYCADDDNIASWLSTHSLQAKPYAFSLSAISVENGGAKGESPPQTPPEGAHIENNLIHFTINNTTQTMSIHELALQGKHNTYNSMAAGIVGRLLDIRKEIVRESLGDFTAVEHRLENVCKVNGIEFVNDSKATNINSTWYALECQTTPVIWIVGGVDKGNDYTQVAELVAQKVKAIICLGVDNEKIHRAFEGIVGTIVDTGSAEEAVRTAYYLGVKGDTVLLSPACASFDLFESYEDRGRQFKSAVRGL